MSFKPRNQQELLAKLNIKALNQMQIEAGEVIDHETEVVLLSPTGSGKTLAFLLPILKKIKLTRPDIDHIQALIVVPTRELAQQIEQVIRQMGTGFKVNAVYGGRAGSKDKFELRHAPAILIGTPGRIAAHIYYRDLNTQYISTLVLDEFDKSLEIGFEDEMSEILDALPAVRNKILTSATYGVEIPEFVGINSPVELNYLKKEKQSGSLKTTLVINEKQTLDELLISTLRHIGDEAGIIFCNYKASIAHVSNLLSQEGIAHGCFYGDLEQRDREEALIKFRNGTHKLLIATDLAARGIDIPDLKFIMHFELPKKEEEFIHRNGRTARMHREGTAYVLSAKKEGLPDFIPVSNLLKLNPAKNLTVPEWKTLYIGGGRRDKISKGDLAGLFFKQAGLSKGSVGIIELKQDCAYVAVHSDWVERAIEKTNNTRLKKKKIRVKLI